MAGKNLLRETLTSTDVLEPAPQMVSGDTTQILALSRRQLWLLRLVLDQRRMWSVATMAAVLGAVLLALPSLDVNFFIDDYFFIAFIEGGYGVEMSSLNLYTSFFEMPYMPWWKTEGVELVNFWRPLSSAVFRFDYLLFGIDAFGYHVRMLLLLAALVGVTGSLYRRLSMPLGVVALLLFAVDEAHTHTSGIICNNHAVLAVFPALCGLVAYLRWREQAWRPGLGLALLGFSVGLLAGETAFAMLAYPLAYELFAARGRFADRMRSVSPVAALAVVYVVAYKLMGYGASGAGFYLDPFGDPLAFLVGVAQRVPILAANLLGAVPLRFDVVPAPFILAAGLALPLALGLFWRALRNRVQVADRREIRWWLAGACMAFAPIVAAPPSERQILVPLLGFVPFLAGLVVAVWHLWLAARTSRQRTVAAVGLGVLLTLHFGVAPWNRVDRQLGLAETSEQMAEMSARVAALKAPADDCPGTGCDDVVWLNAGPSAYAYLPSIYRLSHGDSTDWHTLSASPLRHRLTRTAERTLVLEPVDGTLMTSFGETALLGPDATFAADDTFTTDLYTVEIQVVNEDGPTRVAFHFKRDLEGPGLTFLAREGDGVRRVVVPGVGESVVIEKRVDPPPIF